MTSATWQVNATDGNYDNSINWTAANIPGAGDTAFFGTSNETSITIPDSSPNGNVGAWVFNHHAANYSFLNNGSQLDFFGAGILVNGGSVNITNIGFVIFYNNST